jgi:RNA polymerase sigma-70 factor (ECF subfamily)
MDLIEGEELYRRFVSGGENAFEELVGLYRESLTRYIYGFVSDARDAEELVIDTFAELAVDKKYRGESSLKTYLFSIGRNLALKHIKKYRRGDHVPVESVQDELADYGQLPELDFIREEQAERVHAAMRTIKSEYREVLRLVHFENMSYLEAGKIMRKTEKQIRNLIYSARVSLKKRIDSEEDAI